MKVENQVCTFDQAKRFDELGLDHDSLFHYARFESEEPFQLTQDVGEAIESYSAYSVAELGEMLPELHESYYSNHLGFWRWQVLEHDAEGDFPFKVSEQGDGEYDTEAEARADMLIDAIEDDRIKAEAINAAFRWNR
jgi:hypothetical protein